MTKLLPGKSGILPLSSVLQISFSGSALVLLNCKITVKHGLKKKSEIKLFYVHTATIFDFVFKNSSMANDNIIYKGNASFCQSKYPRDSISLEVCQIFLIKLCFCFFLKSLQVHA